MPESRLSPIAYPPFDLKKSNQGQAWTLAPDGPAADNVYKRANFKTHLCRTRAKLKRHLAARDLLEERKT